MSETEFVTKDLCTAHREVIDREVDTLKVRDLQIEGRVNILGDKIDQILALQTATYHALIYLAVAVIIILVGVLLGRGFDFGILLP